MECKRCNQSYSAGAMWTAEETSISLPGGGPVCHGCYEVLLKRSRTRKQQRKGAERTNKKRDDEAEEEEEEEQEAVDLDSFDEVDVGPDPDGEDE